MPFFRFTWNDGGITGNQAFLPDVSDYSARQALRLQADIESYVAQEWLPLLKGFGNGDMALLARELSTRVQDYIEHTYIRANRVERDGMQVTTVTTPLPAVLDLPEEEGHGVRVRFRPGSATFTICTIFWLFLEERLPQRHVVYSLPEFAGDRAGDEILVALIDGLKYRLKHDPRTPLQEECNRLLNVFIAEQRLDTDPHAFATLPPDGV